MVSSGFRRRILSLPEGEFLKYCMQCSLCSSICPAARIVEEFNPRRLLFNVILGFEEDVVSNKDLWACLNCHLCLESCPMKVKVSHIMTYLKNVAAERGNLPGGFLDELKQIIKTGRSMPLSPTVEKRRAEFSLPPLPQVNVDEIRKLLDGVKLPFEEEER